MDELTKYKKMLKDNETHIKYLTDANKHIKDHIKFLEKFEPVESKETPVTNQWDASEMPESEQ